MKHVDMRKLPAAAQEERRRQVIGLRERGLTYAAIAAQVGLSRTGVFDICKRFAAEGAKGLVSQPRGRKPNEQRLLERWSAAVLLRHRSRAQPTLVEHAPTESAPQAAAVAMQRQRHHCRNLMLVRNVTPVLLPGFGLDVGDDARAVVT